MSKSIAVFGAGPGLGQAVARRYARGGYAVTLVARRSEPLDLLARDLTSAVTGGIVSVWWFESSAAASRSSAGREARRG